MSAMSAIWGMGEYLRCPNLTHTHINGNHGGMILLGIHSEYLEESLLATSMDILNKRLDMLIIPHFGKMDSVVPPPLILCYLWVPIAAKGIQHIRDLLTSINSC
jgi:hypothetical protein